MSRQDILERVRSGSTLTKTVECEAPVGTVTIRSLTQAELDDVNARVARGIVAKGNAGEDEKFELEELEIDIGQSQVHQLEADRLTVAYALSAGDESWTQGEAGMLPPRQFAQLLSEAKALTGNEFFMEAEQIAAQAGAQPAQPLASDVATFRDDARGADDPQPAPGGRVAGADAG